MIPTADLFLGDEMDKGTLDQFLSEINPLWSEIIDFYHKAGCPHGHVILVLESSNGVMMHIVTPEAARVGLLAGWENDADVTRCCDMMAVPKTPDSVWVFGAFHSGILGCVSVKWKKLTTSMNNKNKALN